MHFLSIFRKCYSTAPTIKNSELFTKVRDFLTNTAQPTLESLKLTADNVSKIESCRKNGTIEFQTLDEIKNTIGATDFAKILKICKATNRVAKYISPPLDNDIQNFKTATSIIIQSNIISWARIDRELNTVLDWNYKNFDLFACKLKPEITYETVQEICKRIPLSDLYVFEADQYAKYLKTKNSPTLLLFNLRIMQFTSMLTTMLNIVNNDSNGHKVYYLKTNLASKMFQTLVENEKISMRSKIKSLLEDNSTSSQLPYDKLSMKPTLQSFFFDRKPVDQEMLSQVLGLLITFLEVVVKKNSKCLSLINKSS